MSKEYVQSWKDDIAAAEQLGYPDEVIEKLKNTDSPVERSRILRDARHGLYDKKRKERNKKWQ